jgi:Mycothiol maleylpyruvate isomerase N-terminal domain
MTVTRTCSVDLGPGRSADLDRPTPCASWNVRDVVNHIVGGTGYFAELAEKGAVTDGGDDADCTATDFTATFRQEAERLVAAFRAPGAMTKPMKLPFGEVPGSVCVWIAAGDICCGRSARRGRSDGPVRPAPGGRCGRVARSPRSPRSSSRPRRPGAGPDGGARGAPSPGRAPAAPPVSRPGSAAAAAGRRTEPRSTRPPRR